MSYLKKSLEHYMEEKTQGCYHPDELFKLDGPNYVS